VRPERVVETGVYYGSSSSAILQALHDNGAGHLTSIDLPTRKGYVNADGVVDRSFVENAADTGREVPPYLRDRWSLRLGNSTELLPIVLRESAPISLFFHDSDHSYSHQKWEYESAWPSIRPGGILASDDVDWTPAFREFAKRVHAVSHIFHFGSGVRGLLIKPGTETLREMKSSNEG
jgi:predicted O-methyltransferase YrrM